MFHALLNKITGSIPAGLLVIVLLAGVSSLYVLLRPVEEHEGLLMWTFSSTRAPLYKEVLEEMHEAGDPLVKLELIEARALSRRVMSGFFSGTPLADLIETERAFASGAWRGPLDAVGFVDLTDRLHAEGLYDKINEPSFSPWTSRGRIFGLPNDVHPVLLCYRADIFEEAGIDVETLDTWEKFFAATAHMVEDFTGDGNPDRYVFEMQETDTGTVSALITQAGGGFFDERDRPILDNPTNVRVLAQLVDWATGPDKVTGDLEFLTGAGNRLRGDGFVLSWVVPDWRAMQCKLYIGELAGKVKLMPLPAWEEGGCRTSVWGGTMLGIAKSSEHFEESWKVAKDLYLSREQAAYGWKNYGVLTPYKPLWEDPVFSEPDPYFCNQATGRLYIEQAPHVPRRTSSPYWSQAARELANALGRLVTYARTHEVESTELLESKAEEYLGYAQKNMLVLIERNGFLEIAENAPTE